jgi:hypothetical protein
MHSGKASPWHAVPHPCHFKPKRRPKSTLATLLWRPCRPPLSVGCALHRHA